MNRRSSAALVALVVVPTLLDAQDRLKTLPGYDAVQRVAREAPAAVTGAVTGVAWVDDGRAFEYDQDGKHYRFELGRGRASEAEPAADRSAGRGGRGRGSGGAPPE